MRGLTIVGTILLGSLLAVAPVLVPAAPIWQIAGGTVYGVAILTFVKLLDTDFADEFEWLRDSGYSVWIKGGLIFFAWLVAWLLWPALGVFLIDGRLPWFFSLGSLFGWVSCYLIHGYFQRSDTRNR